MIPDKSWYSAKKVLLSISRKKVFYQSPPLKSEEEAFEENAPQKSPSSAFGYCQAKILLLKKLFLEAG